MKAYELLFFVDPSLDPETRLAVMKRIDTTIAEGAGKVDSVDEWGKRKLAYTIKGKTHGYYVIFYYKAESNVAASLEAAFKIDENVLRWMTLVDYPMSETVYDQSQAQSTEEVTPIDSEDGEAE